LRRLALIVNPSSAAGRTAGAVTAVREELDRAGLEHHTELTRSLAHARELAQAAAHADEIAVAFGGDGLVGAVAGALPEIKAGVLGVLPGGRGNDFARVLGIPLEPRRACAVLASGVERKLDIGQAGDRTFIGIASCGLDSDANRIANEARRIKGNLVYAYGALRALAAWKPATFTVTVEGATTNTVRGYTIAAANSKAYGGGMYMAPDASLEDGLIDVVIISDMPKLRVLALLPTVFKGHHVRHRGVTVLRAREVTIAADRPFTMYADGDPIGDLPLTVRALPSAVTVITPQ
jgi:YegS/Rv2252/BmrU family lipid kinase